MCDLISGGYVRVSYLIKVWVLSQIMCFCNIKNSFGTFFTSKVHIVLHRVHFKSIKNLKITLPLVFSFTVAVKVGLPSAKIHAANFAEHIEFPLVKLGVRVFFYNNVGVNAVTFYVHKSSVTSTANAPQLHETWLSVLLDRACCSRWTRLAEYRCVSQSRKP